MNQATKIHRQGQRHIVDLARVIKQLWVKLCGHDGIDPDAKFVVFSEDNPFRVYYNNALKEYWESVANYQAGGYVGLRMSK